MQWFVVKLLVHYHSHYNTAKALYSVEQEKKLRVCSADDGWWDRNSAVQSSHFFSSPCVTWWN